MKRTRITRWLSVHQRGQSAVEFALIAPFLLGFIFFIVDMSFLAYSYVSAANAVRDGARCGAIGGSPTNVVALVNGRYAGTNNAPLTITNADITYTPNANPGAVGVGDDDVVVTGHVTYTWMTPLSFIPGLSSVSFNKAATMRMETTVNTGSCT